MRLALSFSIAVLLLAGCGRHPTDAKLQVTFRKDFVALTNLVTELKSVKTVKRVEWDSGSLVVNSAQTNPPQLTAKLLPHFKVIGQPLLVTTAGECSQIRFNFSRRGLSVSGSTKGIVYQDFLPDRIVQDTDIASRANAPFTVFRPLQTNWFIFFSR